MSEKIKAALDYLDEVNLHAQIPYHIYSRLHDLVSTIEKAHTPTDTNGYQSAGTPHTPTDDEREAHRRVIELWFANWRDIGKVSPALELAIDSLEGMVDDALDAGFRRADVSSSADEREEIARIIDGHINVPVSSRLAIARSLQGNGFRRSVVPEPSDEEFRLIETAGSFREQVSDSASPGSLVDLWLRTAAALEARVKASPAGEPSDGQMKAFEDEWYRLDGVTEPERHRRALRAALRAAGDGVRDEQTSS